MNGLDQQSQNNGLSVLIPEKGIDFKKIINLLYRHIWIILAVAICGGVISFLHTFTIIPVYQTTALLKLNSQQSGSNSMLARFGGLGGGADDSGINTQEALIHTRYILEPVIIRNQLNILISPHYFPFFGTVVAKYHQGSDLAKPFMGLKSYAWGGESIKVETLSAPTNFENQSFRLVAGKENMYELYTSEGKSLLTGKVGELNEKMGIKIKVSTLKSNPGTYFDLRIAPPVSLIDSLAHKIKTTNIYGNDPMQSTGIFQISLTDTIPEQAIKILNSIINYVVEKNKIEKNEETQRSLSFLNQKFPEVKSNLEESENSLNQYHSENTVLTMSSKGQALIQKLYFIEQLINKLKTEYEDLLQIYTEQHPLVSSNLTKQAELNKQLEVVKNEIRQFPMKDQKEINLMREMKIKNSFYVNLLNDRAKLEFAKSRITSNIIILSDAMPVVRLPSHKLLLVLMGFFMGAFLASLAILIKNGLIQAIENSEQIEEKFKIPVQAIIPFSRKQKEIEKKHRKWLNNGGVGVSRTIILAKEEPEEIAIESLRSLRISLEIMHSIVDNRVICIMGSLSNIGKSFVSLNFSQIMADSGKRTLLIDADIRRGRIHNAFNQQKNIGLSEYLEGKCDFNKILRKNQDNLYFISCGKYSDHPLKLFQNTLFKDLITKIKGEFDQIIIDTPPIIPVSDSLLIAKYCDAKLLVVSVGKDTIQDVKEAVKKLNIHDVELNGIILNHRDALGLNGSKHHYRYSYKTETYGKSIVL